MNRMSNFVQLIFVVVVLSFALSILFASEALAFQQDSSAYRKFNDFVTVYTLSGYNATNFSISPRFNDLSRQRYVFNPPLLIGFGVAYKGLDLGLTRRLPNHLLNTDKYGKSDYTDFKFKASIQRFHLALRFQKYTGFALLNYQNGYPDSINQHLLHEDLSTFSLNLDARYFLNKDFNYGAAQGFSGEYLSDVWTPYVYGYFGGSNIKNNDNALLPSSMQIDQVSISQISGLGCLEFGAIPGAAFVKRMQNFQTMLLLGWGPLIQTKWHRGNQNTRTFFGFSSRTDLQLSLGYHQQSWFLQVMSEFQFRRVNFPQLNVQQYYYDLRLFFGYLIPVKKHPKIVQDLEDKGLL